MKQVTKITLYLIVLSAVACSVFIVFSNYAVKAEAEDMVYTEVSEVPEYPIGLVLGCSWRLSNGRENLFFRYRIEKAAELYTEGKVQQFIVSGDNSHKEYDEPSEMKAALIEAGIPESQILCDYAGFSTLDSIIRAERVFGQDKFIVISQRFHAERAVYIGLSKDIDIIGVSARNVTGSVGLKTHLREYLARVKMMLDIHVLNRSPKFLGDPVHIPLMT